jgi:hypothetical protein
VPFCAAGAAAAVDAAVVGVALAVAVAPVAALADAVAPAVAFFVATGFELFAIVVAAVVATATVDDNEADALVLTEPIAAPPAIFNPPEDNCGGVIASTAPRPPTEPPAINSARFISYPHFFACLDLLKINYPYINLLT